MSFVDLRAFLHLVSRFALTGVINTMVGASITLTLDLAMGVKPAIANAAGYAVGIFVSWFLQRRFVFRSGDSRVRTKARYLTTMAVSFGVNQIVLWAMGVLLGGEPLARAAAQILAMCAYTSVQFVLLQIWVFPPKPPLPREAAQ